MHTPRAAQSPGQGPATSSPFCAPRPLSSSHSPPTQGFPAPSQETRLAQKWVETTYSADARTRQRAHWGHRASFYPGSLLAPVTRPLGCRISLQVAPRCSREEQQERGSRHPDPSSGLAALQSYIRCSLDARHQGNGERRDAKAGPCPPGTLSGWPSFSPSTPPQKSTLLELWKHPVGSLHWGKDSPRLWVP